MDFATIGTLSSYVKQKNLLFAAKHKIRTGQTLTNANGNFISMNTSTFDKLRAAAKSSLDQAKAQKLALIKRKLKAGQKLSDEELGFLRVNDPKTYKKAKAADDAREELKDDLKKAKTKGEAREAMTRAMIKASSAAMAELSALGAGGGNAAGGSGFSGGGVSAGGENISGGEVSAGGENFSATENKTLVEVNQSIQNSNDQSTDEKNPLAQKNSDDGKNTPEDIMEKYIWTIRALENEWAKFTNSQHYRDLPETKSDEAAIHRKVLSAVSAYRKAMTA